MPTFYAHDHAPAPDKSTAQCCVGGDAAKQLRTMCACVFVSGKCKVVVVVVVGGGGCLGHCAGREQSHNLARSAAAAAGDCYIIILRWSWLLLVCMLDGLWRLATAAHADCSSIYCI